MSCPRCSGAATAGTHPPRRHLHCDGAGRVLRGWQRRDRYFFSQHTGTPTRRTGHRGRSAFVNGRWVPGRRLNGDDSDEGNFLMLDRSGCCWPPAAKSIQRFTLYRYQ